MSLPAATAPAPGSRYQANFTKGGLMVPESRVIAGLLLDEVSDAEWKEAIEVRNVLEKRSVQTASTKAGLIRRRLETMGPELWRLVRDGGKEVATQAALAVTIKYSRLIGDFLDTVIRDLHRGFEQTLRGSEWARFLEACRAREPEMPEWYDSTVDKLRTRIYGILSEAGYLSDSRKRILQPVFLAPEVAGYLQGAGEDYVLRCMQAAQA